MSFNSFGYNGVFELRKPVVDRLLAQVYERTQVREHGVVRDDEFVSLSLPEQNGTKMQIYLKTGRPVASFAPSAAQENRVDLSVPAELALFTAEKQGGVWKWQKRSLLAVFVDLSKLIFRVKGLHLQKARKGNTDVLRPALTGLTGQNLEVIYPQTMKVIEDKVIDTLLSAVQAGMTAAVFKDEVMKELRDNALKGADIEIPSAGANINTLEKWEHRILSRDRAGMQYDSFDLLLYGPGAQGQGVLTQAGHTIPGGATPAHSFALSMRRDIFLAYLNAMLGRKGYYKQGGGLNTPANPYGHMVVLQAAPVTYTLPHPYGDGAGKPVTLSAPQNGVVTVTIPKDGLSPNCRATLTNEDTGQSVNFNAGSDGAATVQISANNNARLTITVRGVSARGDKDAIIFRPSLSLHDGRLRLSFDYYYIIRGWCDAEGDGYVDIGIDPDPDEAFNFKIRQLGLHVSLPWWSHVVAFLAGLLIGWLIGGPIGGVLGGFIALVLFEAIGPAIIGGIVGEKLDKELQDQLKFPAPGGGKLALFLESVQLFQTGIILSGYADAGNIVHYGRKPVEMKPNGVLKLGTGKESFTLHFTPLAGGGATLESHWPLWSSTAADELSAFLDGRYEEGSKLSFAKAKVTLAPGTPVRSWVQTDEGLAKLYVTWDVSNQRPRVSWVFFRRHVKPGLGIKNEVATTIVSASNMVIGYRLCFSHEGYLALDPVKFFRTEISREAGLEKWYWNGQEIPQGGTLNAPGFSIRWETKSERIIVEANQSKLVSGLPQPPPGPGQITPFVPQTHVVEYVGEDVFGTKMSAKVTLRLEACVVGTAKLFTAARVWPFEILPDPPWTRFALPPGAGLLRNVERVDEWERGELAETLHGQLAELAPENWQTAELAETIAGALLDGEARLDWATALGLLLLLGDRVG